ncbi:hypothetical protein SLEP1_g15434 [Rubroshorea leprosula]|uniref:Uncharacterized protein n=1 Tax=Rubroshorea leprosula TaxID=152421 RepID=A0AAV5IMC2_9ROSI|nr:hypothetical protein SLEP1_g15434 [Rubroshorea leprosula]
MQSSLPIKVGIKLDVVPEPPFVKEASQHSSTADKSTTDVPKEGKCASKSQTNGDQNGVHGKKHGGSCHRHQLDEPRFLVNIGTLDSDEEQTQLPETTVWICCDVYDTGIGIPVAPAQSFYVVIFSNLETVYIKVELMGGRLTVSSRVHCGSTFTYILPYKNSLPGDNSDDPDELSDVADHDAAIDDSTAGFFQFHPRTLGSVFSSNGSSRIQKLMPHNIGQLGDGLEGLWKRVIWEKYYGGQKEVEVTSFASLKMSRVWKDIVSVGSGSERLLEMLVKGFKWKVGDGSCVNFWSDKWVGEKPLKDLFPRWRHGCIGRAAGEEEQLRELINGVKLRIDGVDSWRWIHSGDGSYSYSYSVHIKWQSSFTRFNFKAQDPSCRR